MYKGIETETVADDNTVRREFVDIRKLIVYSISS